MIGPTLKKVILLSKTFLNETTAYKKKGKHPSLSKVLKESRRCLEEIAQCTTSVNIKKMGWLPSENN